MKKLMGFLLVLVFIVGIIFVLLPFLETTPPPSAATTAQARPRPQIFTSNPLTTLVKRIVNALQTEWDKKREKRRLAVARMQEKRNSAPTDYRAALVHSLPQDGTPAEEITLPEGDESNGDWLIAPQISPEGVETKGMHEVNVNDAPAQSTNEMAIPLPQEQTPIKDSTSTATREPLQMALANKNLDISLPATQAQTQRPPAAKTKSEVALQNLLDALYPEKKIERIVRDMADIKFGMLPNTEENRQAKAAFIKETSSRAKEKLRHLQAQEINRLLTEGPRPDEPQTDYLAEYLQACAEEGKEPEKHTIRVLVNDSDSKTYPIKTDTVEVYQQSSWTMQKAKALVPTINNIWTSVLEALDGKRTMNRNVLLRWGRSQRIATEEESNTPMGETDNNPQTNSFDYKQEGIKTDDNARKALLPGEIPLLLEKGKLQQTVNGGEGTSTENNADSMEQLINLMNIVRTGTPMTIVAQKIIAEEAVAAAVVAAAEEEAIENTIPKEFPTQLLGTGTIYAILQMNKKDK